MDDDAHSWTYEGPVELAGVVRAKVDRVSVNAALMITVEQVGDVDGRLPPLRSWGGSATVTDHTGDLVLQGKCTLTLPNGESGEAYVSTTAEQGIGERRLSLDVQGVGKAPWWSEPDVGG